MSNILKSLLVGCCVLIVCGVLMFAGCTVGPDYKKPQVEMPQAWLNNIESQRVLAAADIRSWWKQFNDPALEMLIEDAIKSNFDLKQAVYRIEEARALRDYACGRYMPDVNGSGFYERSKASENGLSAVSSGVKPDPINQHALGLDASWEIDLFGQIRRNVESSQASYEASIENWRDVLVSLSAEVARNYVELRTTQARLEFARNNVSLQQSTLKLTQDRFSAELVPELDVFQATLNLKNTESEIPSLKIQENLAINRIAVLIGKYPSDVYEQLSVATRLPQPSDDLVTAVPAEILRSRPDIRRAERELAAQTAKIGVARADLYPAFSLQGTFGLESVNLNDLGNIHSRTWGFGPSFRWNIWDGDRIRNLIKVEQARTQRLLAGYESTVLKAVEDVENSLVSYKQENLRTAALEASVDYSAKSVALVNDLYRSGLTDFQNVLDMQRTLSVQQDRLAVSQGLILQDLISVYKSFGGGWSQEMLQSDEKCINAE